jgi:hypothetical protein
MINLIDNKNEYTLYLDAKKRRRFVMLFIVVKPEQSK